MYIYIYIYTYIVGINQKKQGIRVRTWGIYPLMLQWRCFSLIPATRPSPSQSTACQAAHLAWPCSRRIRRDAHFAQYCVCFFCFNVLLCSEGVCVLITTMMCYFFHDVLLRAVCFKGVGFKGNPSLPDFVFCQGTFANGGFRIRFGESDSYLTSAARSA